MLSAIRGTRERRKSAHKPKFRADPLPFVQVEWTKKELTRLAELLSSTPAKPTDALARAMKG
ncbi:MAG TPA: hypothetical protein VGP62_04805 [Bryobacteraceae bacterium]|nr:hypothetical protein [Bryobacteraceae bacterium]